MTGTEKKRSILWYCGMTVLLFFYIYQFNLTIIGLPMWLHSIRLASVVMYLLFIVGSLYNSYSLGITKGAGGRFYKKVIKVHIAIFLYMVFLFFAIGVKDGNHMVVILINFFLFTIIPIYICSKLFQSWDEFLHIVLFATLLQSVFIWISTLDPAIATFFDLAFNADVETFEDLRVGYSGGIGCITAPGYIRYSIGEIACFYFAAKTRNPIYFILYLFMLLTGAMIARTGLIAGLLGLIFLLIYSMSKASFKSILSFVVVSVLVIFIATNVMSNSNALSFFQDRFARTEHLISDSRSYGFLNFSFFEQYMSGESTVIPPLSFETLVGTGVPSGESGNGVKVNVDGGFFRLYVAYGLILAIVFYIYLFFNMIRTTTARKDRVYRYVLTLTILFFIIAEYKEWSVYASPYIWFFATMAMIADKNKLYSLKTQIA